MEYAFQKELFDFAIRIDDEKSRSTVCEDWIINVSPLNVIKELWFVELLKVHHVRNIIRAVSEFVAIVESNDTSAIVFNQLNIDFVRSLLEVKHLCLKENLFRIIIYFSYPYVSP